MQTAMRVTDFVLTERAPRRPYRLAVKRYQFPDYTPGSQPGTILIAIHPAGCSKEIWEPFLEELAQLDAKSLFIKEVWSFESPDSGESAVLNEKLLFDDPKHVTLEEFTHGGLSWLRSGLIQDMDKHRVVAVGHSAGACVAVWMASMYKVEENKTLDGLILIEANKEIFHYNEPFDKLGMHMFIKFTRSRKDIWPSKEEAREYLVKRAPYKSWDSRAVDAYVKHCLRPLPTPWYPDRQGVTLSQTREQEVNCYDGVKPEMFTISQILPYVRQFQPIHIFVSDQSPLRPSDERCKELASFPGVSLSYFPPGSGHLIVEEQPKTAALAVFDALHKLPTKSVARSRL